MDAFSNSEAKIIELNDKITSLEKEVSQIKKYIGIDIKSSENTYYNIDLKDDKIYKTFDNNWVSWIESNIRNRNDKNGLFNILLNHNFKYNDIVEKIQFQPTLPRIMDRKMNQEIMKTNHEFKISFYKCLQDNPKVYRIENNFLEIYKIYDFLSCEECDALIQAFQNEEFIKSEVSNKDTNKEFRTSTTCHLFPEKNPFYADLNNKICAILDIDKNKGEILQAQKYVVGQEFKEHTDYFDKNTEYNKPFLDNGGQRTWTFMIYLNNVDEGGQTRFPRINMEFHTVKGMAVVWNNLINEQFENYYSLHCGMPVLNGEKYIITKWFRLNATTMDSNS